MENKPALIQFSFFNRPVQNTFPACNIGIKTVQQLLTGEGYVHATQLLRSLKDPAARRKFKARNFDYCCFSGVFSKRNENGLISHSELLTIDFDHVPDVQALKSKLVKNKHFETILLFISPSGDGLKWIVKIDLSQNTHLQWFIAMQRYIKKIYQLDIDPSGKDVSRCCFLPYDPEVYVNPKYII